MEHHHKPEDDLEPLEDDVDLESEEGALEDEDQNEPPAMPPSGGPDFYQRQMHLQNRRDIRTLQAGHSKMMTVLTKIAANTEDLPKIKEDVDELKESRARVKGAMWAVGIGSPVLSWLASRIFKL
jgi:hypothetical protein